MGIDDRDYMRERHRTNAKGFKPGRKKAQPHIVDMEFNYSSGRWEEPPAHPKARPRFKARRPRSSSTGMIRWLTPGPMVAISFALLIGLKSLMTYDDARKHGYLPEFGTSQPFPESGEFKVRGRYASGGTARFTITAGERNAVVQLVGQDGIPVFMTFVRMNEMAAVLAPHGTWM